MSQLSFASLSNLEFCCLSSVLLFCIPASKPYWTWCTWGSFPAILHRALLLIQIHIHCFNNLCFLLITNGLTTFQLLEKRLWMDSVLNPTEAVSSGSWTPLSLPPSLLCLLTFDVTQWSWPSYFIWLLTIWALTQAGLGRWRQWPWRKVVIREKQEMRRESLGLGGEREIWRNKSWSQSEFNYSCLLSSLPHPLPALIDFSWQ